MVVWMKNAFPCFSRSRKPARRVPQLFVDVGKPADTATLHVPLVDEAVRDLGDRAKSTGLIGQGLTQASLAFLQRIPAQAPLPSHPRGVALVLHRGCQSIQKTFLDAVVRSRPHEIDCRLRVDPIRNHEERDVGLPFSQ